VARQEIVTSLGKPGRVDLQARRRRKSSRLSGAGVEARIFSIICRQVSLHAHRVCPQLRERQAGRIQLMTPCRLHVAGKEMVAEAQATSEIENRIEKYIGRLRHGVFGAPLAHSNDAEQAMRTALAISAAIPDLSARVGRPIGVAGGQVVASRTGSTGHSEYNVTGDTINLASHGCRRGRRNPDVGATAFRFPAIPRLNGSRRDDSAAFLGDYPAESGAMVPMVVGPDKLVGHLLLFGRQAGV